MLSLITPAASFVRFDESGIVDHCIFDNIRFCLPVFDEDDVHFQFIISGTKTEIDGLCGAYGTPIQFGIVNDCDQPEFLIEFEEQANIFRLGDGLLLVNWEHGLPNFDSEISVDECFRVRVQIGLQKFCSNCFQRIGDDCFTSVLEYGNEENAFDFNYCAGNTEGDTIGETDETCLATLITFTAETILNIPYTAALQDKHGDSPDVDVWIFDISGELIRPMLAISLDTIPPTMITIDLGGVATGVVVIK